ncbi:MAG: YchF/TatD family DNA exonuclease [Actinobacteria bacterium]|nr:YchF/TatD family DNA exonuclease [Actinomycetota bacterium]
MKDADGTRQKLSYPDLPEPLLVGTYDNHTHLEIADGDQPMNYQDHLALANQVGILGAVQVGVTLESSRWSAEVAATEPRLLAAVAIHPNEAARYESMQALDVDIDGIADLASQERVRAIGETGLDFFRTESDQGKSFQQHSFERHIQIAKDFGLALQIHDRDAHEQVVETLQRVGAPEKVVFHCYSGDIQLAKICAEHGWYTSFAGNITIKRNQHLRDSFRHMPKDLILVETDAPFLTPEPLRGRPNAPYLVPITVRFMAAELGMDANELSGQLAKNTVAVYGSWGR